MRLSLALAVVPALWACTNAPPSSRYIEQNPRQSLELNLKETKLSCASESECPENVGFVLANFESNGLVQCTGWLVAPDVVATNSHCIPDAMKDDPAACRTDLGIKMPATNGHAEEILLCVELLHFSKITSSTVTDADYAFFRVSATTTRTPLKFNRDGIADGQRLILFSVDPQSTVTPPRGSLVRRECTARKGSAYNMTDTDANSEVAVAFGRNCDVRSGNSGSPVLNVRGDAVGWLHAGMPASQEANPLLRPAIMTNAACIASVDGLSELGAPGPKCKNRMN